MHKQNLQLHKIKNKKKKNILICNLHVKIDLIGLERYEGE